VKNLKRITLFAGHYGSGKTNVAVAFAKKIKQELDKTVCIYDLDIVNPYFRTVDASEELKKFGVETIVSPFAESNVDLPALSSASYRMIDDKNAYAVVDIGGDDRGALALGRFSPEIAKENDYDLLFVVNKYRPETRDLDGAIQIFKEIEYSGKLKFTGIVNNSNLGVETTPEMVINSVDFVEKLSNALNLPVKFTAVKDDLFDKVKNRIKDLLPVSLIKYGNWL